MTDYSFRQEIIWPELPEPSPAQYAAILEKLQAEIDKAFFVPVEQIKAEQCGCCGPLHHPNCRHMGP